MKKTLFIAALLTSIALMNAGSALECMYCHQFDWIEFPLINISFFGVHADVNSTDGVGNLTSADCIACHYTANTLVFHGSSVSTYTCEDCHIRGVVPSAPRIYNHNRNANVSVTASCGDCHNKTSNLFRFSANSSAAHYGRNPSSSLPSGEQYCGFCHDNSSSVYSDVMQNQNNIMIGKHTSGIINPGHPAGHPDCTSCHGTDSLHGPNLTKPVLDSGFCNNCHKNDPLKKDMHAGKLECIQCHTDTANDIHNIKYLLQDGTYRSINATDCYDCHGYPFSSFRVPFSTANCTTCHLGNGVIKFAQAPRFPSPMKHSSNPVSGGLWNGSQPAYWGDQVSACKYCHGDTLHNTNALGNISNIKSGNAFNQSITNSSFWCANCHYQGVPSGNYSYNGTSFNPVPPEIKNNSGLVPFKASDGTSFYNHSLGGYSDATCILCHGANFPTTTSFFIHNVSTGGGGRNCISCHDIGGGGAPLDRRVDVVSFNNSVHYSLNGGGNGACWACHGDGNGSENAQPAGGHPRNYRTPKNCNNNDCHSISQSRFKEPMVYSHFLNASRNSNPGNVTDFNITTSAGCEICHINSIIKDDDIPDVAKVSHYGSKQDLLDSFNCIYCHLDEDNSERWGNATLINKNRTVLTQLEKMKNNFILFEGDSFYLGEGYFLKLVEISNNREEAFIQIFHEDNKVDETSLGPGSEYIYEKEITIDNSTFKTPALILNITSIFKGNRSFVQFEGSRLRKIHTENESRNSACYACHLYRYSGNKQRYLVIDKEYKENADKDILYLSRVFLDFKSENKNKIYFNDEDYVFNQTEIDFGKHISYSFLQKSMKERETWDIADGYSLKINEVSTDSEKVWLDLVINNSIVDDRVVALGSEYNYTPGIKYNGYSERNVTIFSATISSIFQGSPNFVILKDVMAISPDIFKINGNTTIFGYNSSWLRTNDTITVGKIPPDFHSPNMFTDQRKWGDCVICHDSSNNIRIKDVDAISSRLGKHLHLNENVSNRSFLSDPIDKACWACHTNGTEPDMHSPTYIIPRDCKSCHVYQLAPVFGAINISDEPHASEKNCGSCHLVKSHVLIRYQVSPVINEASVSQGVISRNITVELSAKASAGYEMKIRAAEYFLDNIGNPGTGTPLIPLDGKFDSQNEELTANINTTDIPVGEHVIFVHAMERNNRWGDFYTLYLNVTIPKKSQSIGTNMISTGLSIAVFLIVLAAAYLMITRRSWK
ncbi:MAG: hypothetical protein J5U19_02195 [Candidatus Methanoperedens sp.]|nr:hypothetical protein [Candidatus Methanoperedens sp.]